METFRKSSIKPWKKGPTRGKGEESALAYDEAARRLYGPDAYLNLPHLQPNSYSHPTNRFKWIPSKDFISMFPSCGLLNINAQPSVHVIHQRLEELKKNNGALNQSSSSSSSLSSCESKTDTQVKSKKSQRQIENLTTKEKDVDILSEEMLQREKPQIDINEFLQQLRIVSDEKQSQTEGIAFGEKSFNWDALIEMNGIGADHQGVNASFHVHDILEELMWPTSIWTY
ncbi:hypothetical protein SLEP1_g35119 [Rubroshorea leprosula]|uniref:AP2/ERF domain-containing protein n=1 Tax=Rubroshorea leprosula TaxID=152421 RepID=A0AAV5KMI3_9ROSI|nr:hypothetical protein SLEP1_g35119 [Rubroshorea leprosula]